MAYPLYSSDPSALEDCPAQLLSGFLSSKASLVERLTTDHNLSALYSPPADPPASAAAFLAHVAALAALLAADLSSVQSLLSSAPPTLPLPAPPASPAPPPLPLDALSSRPGGYDRIEDVVVHLARDYSAAPPPGFEFFAAKLAELLPSLPASPDGTPAPPSVLVPGCGVSGILAPILSSLPPPLSVSLLDPSAPFILASRSIHSGAPLPPAVHPRAFLASLGSELSAASRLSPSPLLPPP
ncbi:hypothetical protein TeGR_g2751, partial [Tetraparma gracilis]